MTAESSAGAVSHRPEDWHSMNWKAVNEQVRRLQARIVQATKAGKWHRVKALQYLLTCSFSGKARAVKRVTENQGQNTPGVDRIPWTTPKDKWTAIHHMQRRGYPPRPLRRVYIPKANGKRRPWGLPTMQDRAMQALYLLTLDPMAETTADPNSYGCRKERSCADAMVQCDLSLSNTTRPPWILEGDIKSCVDQISQNWLRANIPMDKATLQTWLKAGYLDKSAFHMTDEGTPQGGILSPVLANLALNGLERILRKTYPQSGQRALQGKNKQVNVVRYADDFVITGISHKVLEEEVQPLLVDFLRERGLELSQEKTTITPIEDGFDFLGQNVRKYNGKLLIHPSKKNVKTFLTDSRKVIRENKQATAYWLRATLNPNIRGWANYHQHANAKKTFVHVDTAIFTALWRWGRRRHPKKGKRGVATRYVGRLGTNNWRFFGRTKDKEGQTIHNWLCLASAPPIRQHPKIKGDCNPYDPAWEIYLEERLGVKMHKTLHGRRQLLHLWKEQGGTCPVCTNPITSVTGWHNHPIVYKTMGGADDMENRVLVHPNCHRQVHAKGLSVSKPRPVTVGHMAQLGAEFHA